MDVKFPAVGSKDDGTRIQAPLPADKCMESSSGIAGECAFCRRANIVSNEESRARTVL